MLQDTVGTRGVQIPEYPGDPCLTAYLPSSCGPETDGEGAHSWGSLPLLQVGPWQVHLLFAGMLRPQASGKLRLSLTCTPQTESAISIASITIAHSDSYAENLSCSPCTMLHNFLTTFRSPAASGCCHEQQWVMQCLCSQESQCSQHVKVQNAVFLAMHDVLRCTLLRMWQQCPTQAGWQCCATPEWALPQGGSDAAAACCQAPSPHSLIHTSRCRHLYTDHAQSDFCWTRAARYIFKLLKLEE